MDNSLMVNFDNPTEFKNWYLVEAVNPDYGTKVTVFVYREYYVSLEIDEKNLDVSFYNFCQAGKRKIPVSLILTGMYSSLGEKNKKPPRGYARQVFCKLLREILDKFDFVNQDSNIFLESYGMINGSFGKLVNMYKRMGFEIVAYEKNKRNSSDICDKDTEVNDLKLDFFVLMSSPIDRILKWYDTKNYVRLILNNQ